MSDIPQPRIVAHRGASASHPENTAEAFAAARDQGAHGIELDVRRSADDVLVIHHDATLADGRIVRELSSSELPSEVPSLAEALEQCADLWLNIEIKNVRGEPDYDADLGISVAVAALVAAHDAHDRVLVSSFDVESVLRIRDLDPAIPLGMLVFGQADIRSLIGRAEGHRMGAIHPHDLLVDQTFVDLAHAAGLAVNVWTVDDADRQRQLAAYGVDGIITNDPAGAVAALTAD